jgi:hypothetical protein
VALAGCASTGVFSYVGSGVNLPQYRTYAWAPDDQLSTGDPRLDNNPFFQQALQEAVERHLAERALEKTTTEGADLILHYHASITQRVEAAEQEYGCEECLPYVYEAGTLTLDFLDARTNRLVWRGWAERSMDGAIDDQALMERRVEQAVARIIEKFPTRL